MTSEASGSETPTAFSRLHPAIQRWIWDEHWKELRRTQVEAVGPILAGDVDVIVSATTASGKTEAAFLPMLSAIASQPATVPGVEILYMAPLKALINDQFERLSEISARVEVPVHRWHGDVSGSRKHEVLRRPGGLLLITPESLEAFFVLRGEQVPLTFGALRYVVVDELHSFIATERGTQLQSLLNRLELAVRRRIPRIALSATLGDMKSAAEFLRPGAGERVHSIVADDGDQALKLQLRGYLESAPRLTPAEAIAAEKAGEPVTGAETSLRSQPMSSVPCEDRTTSSSRTHVDWSRSTPIFSAPSPSATGFLTSSSRITAISPRSFERMSSRGSRTRRTRPMPFVRRPSRWGSTSAKSEALPRSELLRRLPPCASDSGDPVAEVIPLCFASMCPRPR